MGSSLRQRLDLQRSQLPVTSKRTQPRLRPFFCQIPIYRAVQIIVCTPLYPLPGRGCPEGAGVECGKQSNDYRILSGFFLIFTVRHSTPPTPLPGRGYWVRQSFATPRQIGICPLVSIFTKIQTTKNLNFYKRIRRFLYFFVARRKKCLYNDFILKL